MKNFLLLILILLFVSTTTDTFGQKASAYYTLKIYNKEFYIDDNGYKGVSTAFLHPYKEVKKEWWRYIKSKAIIFNKVSHYELKVPAKGKEDLTPILMVSTIHENEGQTILRIAYKNPTETLDNDNLKQLLIDFKISYFTRILETQIKSQEKKSTKLGNQLENYQSSKKTVLLDSLKINRQIDSFEYEIHQSDTKLDSLKGLLGEVR